jgi:hypothetical protein
VTKAKSSKTLKDAIEAWNAYSKLTPLAFCLIFITDSRTYAEILPEIEIRSGSKLAIVAAGGLSEKPDESGKSQMTLDNLHPHIIGDLVIKKPVDIINIANIRGEFITDGLTVEGSLSVKPCNLGLLHLAHSSFISPAGLSESETSVSISSGNTSLKAILDRCITGPIRVSETIDQMSIIDSLIDGGGKDRAALAGPEETGFGPVAEITRSTLFGAVYVRELNASETIFAG